MNITVSDNLKGLDGWVFLPHKTDSAKGEMAKAPRQDLPLPASEWAIDAEACFPTIDEVIYKAAPVKKQGVDGAVAFQDALGKGLKYLTSRKVQTVGVVLPKNGDVAPNMFAALFETPLLMTHDVCPYKTKPDAKKHLKFKEVRFIAADKKQAASLQKTLAAAKAMVEGINLTRYLVDEPANIMTPQKLAQKALELKKDGVKVSLLPAAVLKKMGGVQAVAAGSQHAPEFIVLELNPGKSKPVLLVGKAVTFDTGGISLKPGDLMWEMKGDMGGGAAVIGTMKALAKLGCKKRVIGLVPAVENMPDGKAVKPGDVITMLDGQTVEVLNTDAEGRLILADALVYGQQFKPEYTIDLATLTGAIIIALGTRFTGLFCNDGNLQQRLVDAGKASHDLMWPMPVHPMFVEEMKSGFADWKNLGGRKGGACLAAGFLSQFVTGPWAHLDIAGTAAQEKEKSYLPKGAGTGMGVKLLAHLIMS
jgi:leucyl aminopeptidase